MQILQNHFDNQVPLKAAINKHHQTCLCAFGVSPADIDSAKTLVHLTGF